MELNCSSNVTESSSCQAAGSEIITQVEVLIQLSSKECIYGDSYWFLLDSIWVDKGCSAWFNVCFLSGKKTI